MPLAFRSSTAERQALCERIDQALPQTQCTKCGYAGCRPYAEAIAFDDVPINQCPPGGVEGLRVLATLTGSLVDVLNPTHGAAKVPELAVIDEAQCIGCTLCIAACPVDAIIGAARLMHVIIADHCSGCELCLPPCPMDCITMQPALAPWTPARGLAARSRFDARASRKQRIDALIDGKRAARLVHGDAAASQATERRRATITAAQSRARARRAAMSTTIAPPKGQADD